MKISVLGILLGFKVAGGSIQIDTAGMVDMEESLFATRSCFIGISDGPSSKRKL